MYIYTCITTRHINHTQTILTCVLALYYRACETPDTIN